MGKLFSYNVGYGKVVIGRDNRASSKDLQDFFTKGLLESGCEVLEMEGVSTSPLLYFASYYLSTDGSVMVTGSHNPLEFNGFKFMCNQASFYGEELSSILNNPIKNAQGTHRIINLDQIYQEYLLRNGLHTEMKIAWECNNSANGRIITQLNLPGEHILLNQNLDGTFYHLQPDPCIKDNLKQLQETVVTKSCNYGFAFDGDGDRLVMIKSNGEILTGDQLIYLMAQSLKQQKNKKILIDVKASSILIKALKAEGFEVIIAPSGHSLMKARIIEEDAVFAGELSGHFIFNDTKFYPFDDALYAALRIIECLQNNYFLELPLAPIRMEYKVPKANIKHMEQIYQPEGLRIDFDGGFLLVRASNTEDYILVKYEAMDSKTQKDIEQELLTLFVLKV